MSVHGSASPGTRPRIAVGGVAEDIADSHPRTPAFGTARMEAALCLATTLLFVSYAAWAVGIRLGAWNAPLSLSGLVTRATMIAVYAIGAALQWRASKSKRLDAATRSAWRLLSYANLGALVLNGAPLLRSVITDGGAPGTAWKAMMIGTFLVINGIVLRSLVRFPVSPRLRSDRITYWLDAGTVGSAGVLLSWHLLFAVAIEQAGGGLMPFVSAVTAPIVDLLLLFAALALLLRRPLPSSAAALRVFTFALVVSAIADVPGVFVVLAGADSATSQLYNVLFVAAGWLFSVAAFVQIRQAQNDDAKGGQAAPDAPSYSMLPYLAVVVVYAFLALESWRAVHGSAGGDEFALLELVGGAAVVTGFVIARQIVVLRRNAELMADRLAREAYFQALIESSSDMLVVLESDGSIREASPAFARAVEVEPLALAGVRLAEFVEEEDRATVRADLAAAAALTGGDRARDDGAFEWRLRSGSGALRWIEVVCTNLLHDPAVKAMVFNGRDVSERKQLEAELRHRADHDILTGLANRARFLSTVERAFLRYTGTRTMDEGGFAVLYVDLDRFKPINDRHGHAAGDKVLVTVADRLRSASRGSDLVARLGGDEFAVYLDQVNDRAEIDIVVDRMMAALTRPIQAEGVEVSVGASIGIAMAIGGEKHGASPLSPEGARHAADALMREADGAMYVAKSGGGQSYSHAV